MLLFPALNRLNGFFMNNRYLKLCPHWKVAEHAGLIHMPAYAREWLLDDRSLTQRVINFCQSRGDGFHVRVLRQGPLLPNLDETNRLALQPRRYCLIREVLLYCQNTPYIFARSIIPFSTLTGRQRRLAHLGNRPLGAYLFSQPDLQRDAMEVSCLRPGWQLFEDALQNVDNKSAACLWARRSVFRLNQKPLLVAEVFLPSLFNTMQNNEPWGDEFKSGGDIGC